MKLYRVSYTENVSPQYVGEQRYFFIRIRPAYKGAANILEHEIEHVRQWWRATLLGVAAALAVVVFIPPLWPLLGLAPFIHGALYRVSRTYRKWAEVDAHKVDYRHGGNLDHLAYALSTNYRLKLSIEEARRLIQRG